MRSHPFAGPGVSVGEWRQTVLTFGGAVSSWSAALAQPDLPKGREAADHDPRSGAWAWLILLVAVAIIVAAFAWLGQRHLGRR